MGAAQYLEQVVASSLLYSHNCLFSVYMCILYGSMNRTRGDEVYWSHLPIDPNPEDIVNTVHIMHPRPDIVNLGNAVQATSYGLKLYLQKNHAPWKQDSVRIMRWLQTQRMGCAVWSSTQVGRGC